MDIQFRGGKRTDIQHLLAKHKKEEETGGLKEEVVLYSNKTYI